MFSIRMGLYVIACTDIPLEVHVICSSITVSMALKHVGITTIMYSFCIGIEKLTYTLKYLPICLVLLLSLEGIFHLYPATRRTFIMPHNTTWQEVTDGNSLIHTILHNTCV